MRSLNFSGGTIKYKCTKPLVVSDASWVDECNEAAAQFMQQDKKSGGVVINVIPDQPFGVTSSSYLESGSNASELSTDAYKIIK
tara:strand:- start:58 stop:309 length:252 start_codon:yes stop_codon:yes gene_type:complete